jgi:NADPH2:quinone reductase
MLLSATTWWRWRGILFDVVRSRKVKIKINQTYLLKEAAEAHQDLDGRKTTGSTVFTI